jgi:hypothetical protein
MKIQKILIPLLCLSVVAASFYYYRWQGLAVSTGLLVMWTLMHFNRMLQVLKRAANRPIGYVGSAVMLNAKLQPNATLLHVVAMTKSLGDLQSPKDTQPEIYRWTDGTASFVTAEFQDGKLKSWTLERPVQAKEVDGKPAAAPAP